MPEDLPRAVIVLVWLLVGTIILGYLIMAQPYIFSAIFVLIFYGVPIVWNTMKGDAKKDEKVSQ
jgi:ABC-type polysaccharide/polyol phosphate export permease